MLYHVNTFRLTVYKLPHREEVLQTSTTLALQNVFKNLQFCNKEVTTKDLTVAFGWTTAEAFQQQDVQEMMRVLIDKLEEKMKGTDADGYIKQTFAGTISSYIKCVNVPYESKREEDFYDIQLDVKGCKNIYESFQKYVDNEMLDGENQYDAGLQYGKQDAQKGVIFTKFPPVLTIHLKRFDFDMNTLNFRKIHDYYEFYDRLNLDQYLAEDSPPESKLNPNNYVLHSVLVHSGDVGGGHYYAYIRPSTSCDYSDISGLKDSGKWFKFNDEIVLQVESREAIQYCYGREVNSSHKMSSAYMLVYIREAEVSTIMKEIRSEDIPVDLVQRLDLEMEARRIKELRMRKEDLFCNISFVTDGELRSFKQYTKFQDFVGSDDLYDLKILKDSKFLGSLLRISDHLNLNPFEIRLWYIDKSGNKSCTFRVQEDLDSDELHLMMTHTRYYVEHIRNERTESENREIMDSYTAIKNAEIGWLDDLRTILFEYMPNDFYGEDDDPTDGCGIGMNNTAFLKDFVLDSLLKSNKEAETVKITNLLVAILEIEEKLLALFKRFYTSIANNQTIVFFKAFDPFNILFDKRSVTTSNGFDDRIGQEDIDVDKEETRSSSSDDLEEVHEDYLPMKYLGSVLINRTDRCNNIYTILSDLFNQNNYYRCSEYINWKSCQLNATDGPSSWNTSVDITRAITRNPDVSFGCFLSEVFVFSLHNYL